LETSTDAASETNPQSATIDEPDFPEAGLMDVAPQMVQTLMLQCLLPCLTPDHDFEQLVYAPWMRCFVLSMEKFISSSKEKALAPNMQPHIELAGETCFFHFPSYMPCRVWPNPARFRGDHLAELRMHCKRPAVSFVPSIDTAKRFFPGHVNALMQVLLCTSRDTIQRNACYFYNKTAQEKASKPLLVTSYKLPVTNYQLPVTIHIGTDSTS